MTRGESARQMERSGGFETRPYRMPARCRRYVPRTRPGREGRGSWGEGSFATLRMTRGKTARQMTILVGSGREIPRSRCSLRDDDPGRIGKRDPSVALLASG